MIKNCTYTDITLYNRPSETWTVTIDLEADNLESRDYEDTDFFECSGPGHVELVEFNDRADVKRHLESLEAQS